MVRKIESTLWTEKYRPRTMEDVVIDDSTRKMLQSFIDKKSVPHSLFVGRPGTGKTTIALILRDKLIKGLSRIPYNKLNGPTGDKRMPGNVNICFKFIEGESMLLLLDSKGISASSGSACTSGSLDPSHVLLGIGRPHEVAHGSLRLSLCEWNTPDEVGVILDVVPKVVEHLRNMSPMWKDLESGKRQFVL